MWQIQACSATSGEGVRDGMEWVIKNIRLGVEADMDGMEWAIENIR